MEVNEDFKEILQRLNAEGAKYLVVGAHAVAAHVIARYTKDIDIWIEPSDDNAVRVYRALAAFGAPMDNVSTADFTNDDLIFQIGVEPLRVDIITSIEAVRFHDAWPNRMKSFYGDVPTFVLGKADLIKNKRAVGRPQDIIDVQYLETGNAG